MMPSGTYSPIPGSSSTENIREHRPEDDPAVQQYLSVSGEFSADLNTEAETNYYLRDAVELLRPSIVFGLARIAKDQRHFCGLLQKAILATAWLEHAERFAGEATEDFDHEQAHRADAAWLLVLLAAGQSAAPDAEWTEALAMCRRVHGAVGARPRNLLEQMLGDLGTQRVSLDEAADGRAGE